MPHIRSSMHNARQHSFFPSPKSDSPNRTRYAIISMYGWIPGKVTCISRETCASISRITVLVFPDDAVIIVESMEILMVSL